jgi:CheY-like chemotaxis protein
MTPSPQTYDELAQNVLRDYLRSAVIIDDQWPEMAVGEADVDEPDESPLVDDEVSEDVVTEEFEKSVSDVPPSRPPDNLEDARLLGKLQYSLLQEGLLACGFRYTHQARDIAIELARRADIVVLDWHLVGDDGADALAILQKLQGNELRFVCIFTGHGRIGDVRHTLEKRLGEAAGGADAGEADLQIGNLVIAIRNKKGLEEEMLGFTVESDKLLAEALGGLARSYNGLVQLAMLELTQEHRRQLPAILERFDKSIDTAVLLEAGDESSPVGQGGAFLAILVDEWRAHLEQEHSKLRALGPEGLELFGSRLAQSLLTIPAEEMEKSLTEAGIKKRTAKAFAGKSTTDGGRNKLKRWLLAGCRGALPAIHGGEFREEERLAAWGALRTVVGQSEDVPSLPLLQLDALFHQQFEPPQLLTQGTLVAIRQGAECDDYYLCITPVCDAERPERLANLFTFLRTELVLPESLLTSRSSKAAYCVVEYGERLLCLEALLKQRIVLAVAKRRFDDAGTVQGCLTLGNGETGKPVRLHRIAQLRSEHALSITAAAAADASRVGVNRVELVRRQLS